MNSALATVAVQPRNIPCPTHVPDRQTARVVHTAIALARHPSTARTRDHATLSITDNLRAVHVADCACQPAKVPMAHASTTGRG